MIAIDLGSNTIRFIKYDCDTKTYGESYEAIVKTADGLSTSHKINKQAVDRIIQAIKDAQKKLDFKHNAVFAVATAAMRLASNSSDVLSEIFDKTGIKFDVISGTDEARYTIYAVKKRLSSLHVDSNTFVLVDIGGGSTEITFVNKESITTKSFDIGIVTLTQQTKSNKVLDQVLDNVLKDVKIFVKSYYNNHTKPEVFIQTAGTPTTLAAYLQGMDYSTYDPTMINGFVLQQDVLDSVKERLLGMDQETRAKYVGKGREDLIITGIDIINKIYGILGFTKALVIDDSLREGLSLYYCDNLT